MSGTPVPKKYIESLEKVQRRASWLVLKRKHGELQRPLLVTEVANSGEMQRVLISSPVLQVLGILDSHFLCLIFFLTLSKCNPTTETIMILSSV